MSRKPRIIFAQVEGSGTPLTRGLARDPLPLQRVFVDTHLDPVRIGEVRL
jgi:hypothetical protein